MNYAGIIKNDVCAADGVCLTFFTQGCPHKCPGCHNTETWDFKGGKIFSPAILSTMVEDINKNGILRKFCIMGGEPLCDENLFITELVCTEVLQKYPDLPIYIWTGYTYEELQKRKNNRLANILSMATCLIDGRFVFAERDITLKMRGSKNQRIIDMKKTLELNEVILMEEKE